MGRQVDAGIVLLVIRGGRSGERIPVRRGRNLVGFDAASDIRLVDGGVSRHHAVVIRSLDTVTIEDRLSSTGTWVNGTRLSASRQLCPGDEVGIGSAALRLEEPHPGNAADPARAARPGARPRRRTRVWRVVMVDGMAGLLILAALLATLVVFRLAARSTDDVALPVSRGSYRTTAEFGDSGPRWRTTHTGLDFAAAAGTDVHAVTAGVVTYSQPSGGAYGILTRIRAGNGVETWYAHQSATVVRSGQRVTAGQVIGAVGNSGNVTGAHLHLEVRVNGVLTDPRTWLSDRGLSP